MAIRTSDVTTTVQCDALKGDDPGWNMLNKIVFLTARLLREALIVT